MLSDWVNGGGNLIAMRPDTQLAGAARPDRRRHARSRTRYLAVDTAAAPGRASSGETMQFHGTADRYASPRRRRPRSPSRPSTRTPTTATANPAVTLRSVGGCGGAGGGVHLRPRALDRLHAPGQPGLGRATSATGSRPIRSDDLFYGAKSGDVQPDWIDLDKVAIPQADEQQRLLANLILQMNADRKPLPRFWYFPRGEKAVVVMTGDDHGSSDGRAAVR